MKKIYLSIFFYLLSFVVFAQSLNVIITQNGKIIEPKNNIYKLRKSTFIFEITAKNIEGFLVGATTNKTIYTSAINKYNARAPWFQNTGMAEELYNKDKELFLMDNAPSYWYFTDEKDHRFDKNPKGNLNNWTAKRTITRFYDIMVDQAIDLKNFDKDVYILMYNPIYNDEYDLVGKKNLFHAILKFED